MWVVDDYEKKPMFRCHSKKKGSYELLDNTRQVLSETLAPQ